MDINRYVRIADSELNFVFGEVEGEVGDKEIANRTLRHFYKEAVNLLFFIRSTGKDGEYRAFMERFRKKFPNAERIIQGNLELEEIEIKLEEMEDVVTN